MAAQPSSSNVDAISGAAAVVETAGGCGFRELKTGVECGCQNFWKSENSNCACGHHACFHAPPVPQDMKGSKDVNIQLLEHLTQLGTLLSGLASTPAAAGQQVNIAAPNTPGNLETIPDTNPLSPGLDAIQIHSPKEDQVSRASTSHLPRLPPQCVAPSYLLEDRDDRRQLPANTSAGLGLWLNEVAAAQGTDGNSVTGQQIPSQSTDDVLRAFRMFEPNDGASDANIPSTRQASGQIMATGQDSQQALLPALEITNFASLRGFDDLLHSATEMATPSIGTRTPDLNIPPAIIRSTIENGVHLLARPSPQNMPPPSLPRSAAGTPAMSVARPSVQSSSQALSPPVLAKDAQTFREISTHLYALRKFITGQGTQLRGLGDRLEAMERMSFSQAPRDHEIIEKLDLIETKIIEVEGKVDDARINGLITSDGSLHVPQHRSNRRQLQLQDHASVATDQSFLSTNSASSSGLRNSDTIREKIDSLDGRVTDLEKSLPPSISRPLQIEVILIPWGRELRGLWFIPGDKSEAQYTARFTTQDSEDWTNSRGLRSSSRISASLRSKGDSGWTNEAIHDWADNADEWLVPRACSAKSVAYHRLKSRGFVRTIELAKPGAKEIQDTITRKFGEILIMLDSGRVLNNEEETKDNAGKSFLGLEAPFIPLRKVHKSSQLRFLAKTEMLTPALWTAEFLLSSVLMHATGGSKRLFITHKDAYLQQSDMDSIPWSWRRIRELARVGSEDGQVEEADAREACWADHPVLDAIPLSVNTSFTSHVSSTSRQSHASVRPASAQHEIEVEEEEMAEIKSESHSGFESEAVEAAKKNKSFVPITPVTENDLFSTQDAYRLARLQAEMDNPWAEGVSGDEAILSSTPHPTNHQIAHYGMPLSNQVRYNLRKHTRSMSNPLAESVDGHSAGSVRPSQQARRTTSGSFKRITRSFSTPSNPLINTIPSFVPISPNTSRPKSRRRVTGDGYTANKRRRVDRSVSAEAYVSYVKGKSRRSRSTSLLPSSGGNRKGKRAATPQGPYMTPYSGNFGSTYHEESVRSPAAGESDEWEGVGDDDHDHDHEHDYDGYGQGQGLGIEDTMQLNTEDLMMDEDEDEDDEDEDEEESEHGDVILDDIGYE